MLYIKGIVIFLYVSLNFVNGYRVLVFFPYPGKSHTILGEGFVRHLVDGGHNVTYVTPIPIKNAAPNLRQIDVSSNFDKFQLHNILSIEKFLNKEITLDIDLMYSGIHEISEISIKHENVQKLLLDPNEQFDLAIVEWLYSDLYSGIPAVFNCPYIWSSSMEPHPMVLRLIDEVPNPAYSPDHLSPVNPPLTFSQRLAELWSLIYVYYVRWKLADKENKAYEEAYGPAFAKRGRKLPAIEEVKFNASMMFGNSHISSGLALTLPQNYIPLAGYHIKKEVPPLPENLKRIMDDAPQGVIYFSLGTMMKSKTMPEEMKRDFLRVFSEIKQVVIWKFEEQLPNLPDNVHILEWAPQPSILAHPNLLLFITHGGLLSTTETLHYGVPVIGIPLFADQFINIHRAVANGFAKLVPLGYDTPEKLRVAIKDILSNPKYRQRVKELSFVYHHRSVSPGQEILHWVEHIVNTNGAKHLRSIALQVPWYQKMYLDLIVLATLSIYFIVNLWKRMFRRRRKLSKKDD